jgi:hypothetical protein
MSWNYADGVSQPRSEGLPEPRYISNVLFGHVPPNPSSKLYVFCSSQRTTLKRRSCLSLSSADPSVTFTLTGGSFLTTTSLSHPKTFQKPFC